MAAETPEQLLAKLEEYKGQLAQVDDLIAADPHNETFQKLKEDLNSVITVTTDLYQLKLGALEAAAAVEGSAGAGTDATASADGLGGAGDVTAVPAVPLEQAEGDIEARLTKGVKEWAIGSRVEAEQGKVWYPGTVVSVASDGTSHEEGGVAQKVTVRYIGFGTTQVVSGAVLRPLEFEADALPVAQRVAGAPCMAKYIADGRWYPGTVQEALDDGSLRVLFTQYGNTETLPVEYLRENAHAKAAAAKRAEAPKPANNGLKEIPDTLKILPTDNDEEIARKRKKIKIIKNQNRFKKKEIERDTKKASWQTFVTKSQKRKKKKGMSGGVVQKRSIFASPDTLDGRVGVVGSGRGMTEFDDSLREKQAKRMRKGE